MRCRVDRDPTDFDGSPVLRRWTGRGRCGGERLLWTVESADVVWTGHAGTRERRVPTTVIFQERQRRQWAVDASDRGFSFAVRWRASGDARGCFGSAIRLQAGDEWGALGARNGRRRDNAHEREETASRQRAHASRDIEDYLFGSHVSHSSSGCALVNALQGVCQKRTSGDLLFCFRTLTGHVDTRDRQERLPKLTFCQADFTDSPKCSDSRDFAI